MRRMGASGMLLAAVLAAPAGALDPSLVTEDHAEPVLAQATTTAILDAEGDGVAELLLSSELGWQLVRVGADGRATPVTVHVAAWSCLQVAAWQPAAVPGDVEGDGRPEVVTLDHDGTIRAWSPLGAELLRELPGLRPQAMQGARILSLEADGIPGDEIAVATTRSSEGGWRDVHELALVRWDGTVAWSVRTDPVHRLERAQLDLDPQPELVLIAADRRARVFDSRTGAYDGEVSDRCGPLARFGDLDGDGRDEILAGTQARDSQTGATVWTSPFDLADAVVHDVDGDGVADVVAPAFALALRGTGVLESRPMLARWARSPAVAGDLDGDCVPELVAACEDGLAVLDSRDPSGTRLDAWSLAFRPAALGNLDGDAVPDLVLAVPENDGHLDVLGWADGTSSKRVLPPRRFLPVSAPTPSPSPTWPATRVTRCSCSAGWKWSCSTASTARCCGASRRAATRCASFSPGSSRTIRARRCSSSRPGT